MSEFQLPTIYESPLVWGPPTEDGSVHNLPNQVYNKSDRLQRVVDFLHDERPAMSSSGPFTLTSVEPAGFVSVIGAARVNALERKKKAERAKRGRGRGGARGRGGDGRGGFGFGGAQGRGRGNARGGRGGRGRGAYKPREQVFRQNTIAITEDSDIIETFELPLLSKKLAPVVPAVTDLKICARPRLYDNSFDQCSKSRPIQLEQFNDYNFTRCKAFDDPVVRQICRGYEGKHRVVFTTDEVISSIMTGTRSINSWDVEFVRPPAAGGRFIFIDKRPQSNIDVQSVHETAGSWDAPNDNNEADVNSASQLGAEATGATRNFRVHSLTKKVFTEYATDKTPFPGSTPTMYRYRKWVVNEGKEDQYDVIVRCEIDAVQKASAKDEAKFIRSFALLDRTTEKFNWEKLDTARGNVLINEVKLNSFQVAKWTCMSILSGADAMKIAFVQRATEGDRTRHSIVGVDTKKPLDFASQIGLNVQNMWFLLNTVLEEFIESESEHAGMVKHCDKQELIMFNVDEKSDDEDSSDDDSDDSDDSSDEDSSDEESD